MTGKKTVLPHNELSRYVRQMALPNINLEGQKKLKQSKVLVVGAGGLASPVLLYLAASGIGHIAVIDGDTVDNSNLHRQILFTESQEGQLKVDSAKAELEKRNHFVNIKTFPMNLSFGNALDVIKNYDVVVDCTDNFPTRYLVNDACQELGVPNVYASISQYEGQCTIFCDKAGPCYRCLYSEPPPPGLIPNCAEGGVLGVLPGLLGVIQATEAIKYLLTIGETLVGRLLTVNVLNMTFNSLPLKRNSACDLCSGRESFITVNRSFDSGCEVVAKKETVKTISVQNLQKKLADKPSKIFILDVREPYEYEISNMGGYLIPLKSLEDRLDEIDTSKQIIVHCKSGMRSAKAVELLQTKGVDALSLAGGIDAWQRQEENARDELTC